MSARGSSSRKSQRLDLKLNLSLLPPKPSAAAAEEEEGYGRSPHGHAASPSASSCLTTEAELAGLRSPMGNEATSMVLAGCSRCLMYVMLSEKDTRCPKCGGTVLLDFFQGSGAGGSASTAARSTMHSHKKTRMN